MEGVRGRGNYGGSGEDTTVVISMVGRNLVIIGAVIVVDFQTVEVMDIRGLITIGAVVGVNRMAKTLPPEFLI